MLQQVSPRNTPKNGLNDKWNLYYHLPQDKSWDLASYKSVMTSIDSAEKIIALNEAFPDNIIRNCMLFIMRDGITPMWEDPQNRNGGCFSFKILNKIVPAIWKALLYVLCGETLLTDPKRIKNINGMTISPKKSFSIVKIWMADCSIQDPGFITNVPNLSKQGVLFKKHAPEF